MSSQFDFSTFSDGLRPMTSSDLLSVLELRNHIEIRKYMLTQHEISLEEHTAWFNRASQTAGTELLILEISNKCSGFVQFKETNCRGVVDWGFYVAPDSPKGTGRNLGMAALSCIFRKDYIHKICGQALDWNKPSIQYHKSLGFTQEGVLREQYFDGEVYHALVCFGILKREWMAAESLKGKSR